MEETTVQERERVMWDEMATPIGWTPVTGQFDDMKGTGSFKSRVVMHYIAKITEKR